MLALAGCGVVPDPGRALPFEGEDGFLEPGLYCGQVTCNGTLLEDSRDETCVLILDSGRPLIDGQFEAVVGAGGSFSDFESLVEATVTALTKTDGALFVSMDVKTTGPSSCEGERQDRYRQWSATELHWSSGSSRLCHSFLGSFNMWLRCEGVLERYAEPNY
ncbi:MAG: hypothetical protein WBE26_12575 [Phycisphaerae bacterium]